MSPFPSVWDSSMLSTLKSCQRKCQLEYVEHWRPQAPNVHLHAGKAFASGLEAARLAFYVEGKPVGDSVALGLAALMHHYGDFECPSDSAKSLERMAGALEYYFDQYPLDSLDYQPIQLPGGKHGIEINFVEPLSVLHPISQEPLLYCGRLDLACHFAGGVFIEDDKTTSSLGASWSKQWDLRSQFTGYCWGLEKVAGVKPSGVLVRGVSILKTKYETQQAVSYRPQWLVDEWLKTTEYELRRAIASWQEFGDSPWIKNFDHACGDWAGCIFKNVCASDNPQPWLEGYFEKRAWNPLTREEEVK
jgi:hypothetical protein